MTTNTQWATLLLLPLLTGLITACGLTIPPFPTPSTVEPVPVEPPTDKDFTLQVLATGLDQPWEILYGPDGYLWVTERMGKRVLRINPADGTISTVAQIDEVYANLSQEGLLGMVLHPKFLQGTENDYVYIAYTYEAGDPPETYAKIRRYQYDGTALVDPVDLITELPASIDHNGGRLTLGPDNKLYYPIGDQGANNFTNLCLPNDAQTLPTQAEIGARDWQHYVGKILRINLDGSIPMDNPLWDGIQSHIYSIGHRNAQGMVAGNGKLYASEHGPKSDDEINQIVAGANYGWPHISGYQDDQAYVYANWSIATTPCASLAYNAYKVPDVVPQHRESEWENSSSMAPLYTFGTVPDGYIFINEACEPAFYICWPTIAPAGIDYYGASRYTELEYGVPGWTDALLVAALKTGSIHWLPLDAEGKVVSGESLTYFRTTNRYRDLAIAPDGRIVYIATDSNGLAQDSMGLPTDDLDHPGAILVFTYTKGGDR